MTTKYRLPCPDGSTIEVDASQAGMTVPTPNGGEVQVPTFRDMRRLEVVGEPEIELPPGESANWGPRQRLMFAGISLAILGGLAVGLLNYLKPPEPLREAAIPDDLVNTIKVWNIFRHGIFPGSGAYLETYRQHLMIYSVIWWLAFATAAAGLLIALGGFLMRDKKPRSAVRRT